VSKARPRRAAQPDNDPIADAVARQVAAMPPGSFAHSDDPEDFAQDVGDAAKPARGSGHDLNIKRPVLRQDDALRILRQRDTPIGRIEATQDLMLERLSRIEERMGAAVGRPRGRPVDARYQLIEDYHALVITAVHALVIEDPARTGLLGTLDTIKRKMTKNLAVRDLTGAGSNPARAVQARKERQEKRARRDTT
jgi:hypothetical protein